MQNSNHMTKVDDIRPGDLLDHAGETIMVVSCVSSPTHPWKVTIQYMRRGLVTTEVAHRTNLVRLIKM